MSATYIQDSLGAFSLLDSNGLGEDAEKVGSYLSKLTESSLESVSLGQRKKDALDSLYQTFCDCCSPGWDGYESSPASYESYLKAKLFLEALPTNFPIPEVAVDPDGEVSFEWYRSPRCVFSVSIGSSDDLSYAGLFGACKAHGTEVFQTAIPKVVLENIRRFLQ